MADRVNGQWLQNNLDAFRQALQDKTAYSVLSSFPKGTTALIMLLSNQNIPFKVIPICGSVKKITNELSTCPKCKGTGKC